MGKILYLDLSMGAAGDMLAAALISLFDEDKQREIIDKLNAIAPEGVTVALESTTRQGLAANYFSVKINGEEEFDVGNESHGHEFNTHHDPHKHHHTSMAEITDMIDAMDIPENVKEDAKLIYARLAEAESAAHGVPVSEVHFHEVGMKDAVMDIVSVCFLMDLIRPDEVYGSPVCTGFGSVKCAHGYVSVPAPATKYLLMNLPAYAGNIEGEMTTPTGAALVSYFAFDFREMPLMATKAVGSGAGKKDFPKANILNVSLGDSVAENSLIRSESDETEFQFNVDDMTGEEIGFAMDRLFAAGALEVYTTPIGMKKSRPGTLFTIIVSKEKREAVIKAIFKYTTTIGTREIAIDRVTMRREIEKINTDFGPVRIKTSEGYGTKRSKLEYDDLSRIAIENNISLRDATKLINGEIKGDE